MLVLAYVRITFYPLTPLVIKFTGRVAGSGVFENLANVLVRKSTCSLFVHT